MRIMLNIYRRHLSKNASGPGCPHKSKGRAWTKCSCPIWIDGTQDGRRLNYALKTTNWTAAARKLRQIENGELEPDTKLKPVEAACREYVEKLTVDGMAPATVKKYRMTLLGTYNAARERGAARYAVPLATAAQAAGRKFVQNLDLEFFEQYRAAWPGGPNTAAKRIDRLRTWCKWCIAHGWLKTNPAKGLAMPKERPPVTLPYEREEVMALLQACELRRKGETELAWQNKVRLKSLILVARYTGLRISDAVMLTPEKVEGGRAVLYMAKTGVPVYVPLPAFLVEQLARTPFRHGSYWFWAGVATMEATADVWRDRLVRVAAKAGVKSAEWHRFRDTFAVELLNQGVSIERVSCLLGHASIKITEKHYSPWVRSRQEHLDVIVAQALSKDPIAQVLELRRVGDGDKEEVRN